MNRSFSPIFSLKSMLLTLLTIFVFLQFYQPVETEDIWWHLSVARWITEHQQFPYTDMFSLSGEDTSYHADQWLGSIMYYAAYQLCGLNGLKMFRSFLFLIIVAIYFSFGTRRIPFTWNILLVINLVFCLAFRDHLRPYVFSFVFIQVFLILLMRHEIRGNLKTLLPLPILSIVWINIHPACIVYGTILIGVFLLSRTIKYLDTKSISALKGSIHLSSILLLFFLLFS